MNRRVAPVRSSKPSTKKSVLGQGKISSKIPPIFRSSVKPPKNAAYSEENVHGVRPTKPGIGLPHLFFVLLSVMVATGSLLYHLHVRFEGVRLGYQASEQRKIQTKLMLKRRELRLELASMKEPGRIEDEAREKLGMETPKSEEFIHVNRKKKVVSVSGGAL